MDCKRQLRQGLAVVALCVFFNKVVVVFIQAAAADVRVPAMYVFGDSLADVGNNNYLPGSSFVSTFRPWGVDYPGGVPTGRFSNGYIFVDFLAMKMGFRQSPPPALAVMKNHDGKLLPLDDFHGLNFASGGSGILDSTGANNSISLATQVDLFAKVVDRLVTAKGKSAADAELSRSPIVISAGTNDLAAYLLALFTSSINSSTNGSSLPPLDPFVTRLVSTYREQLRRIYKLGARKFVFLGVYKAGCIPGARALTVDGSCQTQFNFVAQMFNQAIYEMLRQCLANDDKWFSAEGFQYSVTNAYNLFSMVLANPLSYGFTEVKRACCGLGTFDTGGGCVPNTTNFCSDRAHHLFWDVSHPSQTAAKLIADYGFSGSRKFAYPLNIAQLLHLC